MIRSETMTEFAARMGYTIDLCPGSGHRMLVNGQSERVAFAVEYDKGHSRDGELLGVFFLGLPWQGERV